MLNELQTSLLAIAHVFIAGGVSVHVLLMHRELRSSIGWIGLSWLSPFVGPMIYLAFGINRVGRRASRMRKAVSAGDGKPQDVSKRSLSGQSQGIRALARAGTAITGVPLVQGNEFRMLVNGDEAYPAMLDAIVKAQKSIALSSYIFADDPTGRDFCNALIAAHKRGVAVRVLVDGIGGGYFTAPIITRLKQAGVPAARFLHEWLPWKMSFINLRNHKKLLIVDGQIGFAGGINIADENLSRGHLPKVEDVHAFLEGPIVSHLMQAFARDWEFVTDEPLEGKVWWPEILPAGAAAMRGVDSGPDESVGRIEGIWATAVEQAEKRVRIMTPYFLPEDRLLDVLLRAAAKGVDVEIIVPEASNHVYIDWAMRGHLANIPLDRIKCFMTPEPFDHSKLMTIDGRWCSFGSPNWDARSMRLNFELLVECYDASATAEMDGLVDQKLVGARLLTSMALEARTFPSKLRDSLARLLLPYL